MPASNTINVLELSDRECERLTDKLLDYCGSDLTSDLESNLTDEQIMRPIREKWDELKSQAFSERSRPTSG